MERYRLKANLVKNKNKLASFSQSNVIKDIRILRFSKSKQSF